MNTISMLMAIAVMLVCIGCVGRPYQFASIEIDPDRYEELGYAEVDAGGLMILGVIPTRLNNKIERAVEAAISSKGGDELIDITVQERWFWAWVLNGYRVNIKGMVVKRRAEAGAGG